MPHINKQMNLYRRHVPVRVSRPIPWARNFTNEVNKEPLVLGLRKEYQKTNAVGFIHEFGESDKDN